MDEHDTKPDMDAGHSSPETAMEQDRALDDVLDRLLLLLEETPAAPIAGSHAGVNVHRELILTPRSVLADVEQHWHSQLGAGAAIDDDSGPCRDEDLMIRVVSFLDDEPLALSSFVILAALTQGAGGWKDEPWADALQLRVLERSEALLYRHVLHEEGFETASGEPDWASVVWDNAPRVSRAHKANRAALDLLHQLAQRHLDEQEPTLQRGASLTAALAGLEQRRD